MNEFIKIISTILISSVKFAVGPAFAYYNNQYPFTNFQVILYCVSGGMLGVTVFSFCTPFLFNFFHWVKFEYYKIFRKSLLENRPDGFSSRQYYDHLQLEKKKSRRIFTRANRRIVHIWRTYGLFGIAALTPIIISIPIGSVIATRYVKNKKKVYLYMFISILFWSVAMTFTFEAFHALNVKEVQQKLLEQNDSINQKNFEIR